MHSCCAPFDYLLKDVPRIIGRRGEDVECGLVVRPEVGGKKTCALFVWLSCLRTLSSCQFFLSGLIVSTSHKAREMTSAVFFVFHKAFRSKNFTNNVFFFLVTFLLGFSF